MDEEAKTTADVKEETTGKPDKPNKPKQPDRPDAGGQPRTEQQEPPDTDTPEQETAAKTAEGVSDNERMYGEALKELLGVPKEEALGDIGERIRDFREQIDAKLAAAKEQVIAAELKALNGYDTKLLDRLIDRTKLHVDDSGKVTGLEEAVKQIEAEFPAVKRKEPHQPFVPVNPAEGGFEEGKKMTLSEAMDYANKHPGTDIRSLLG